MNLDRPFIPNRLLVLTVVLAISAMSFAQGHFSPTNIKNFGQMDERFYRGAQPKERDYKELAALGIKTVIDLREDAEPYEKREVEALGMRYINIPMVAKEYPKPEYISEFLKLVDDPATGKFFLHCAGGRHRTGVMGAVYRFNHNNWNYEQVYAEMKRYDFYSSWGHGKMKDFVADYWRQIQNKKAVAAANTVSQ
jgi:protein tyrosine/serine phosphatase